MKSILLTVIFAMSSGCATKSVFVGSSGTKTIPSDIRPIVFLNVEVGSDSKTWLQSAVFQKADPVMIDFINFKNLNSDEYYSFRTINVITQKPKPYSLDNKTKITDTPLIIHLAPGEYKVSRLGFRSILNYGQSSVWESDEEYDTYITIPDEDFITLGTLEISISDKGLTLGDFFGGFDQDTAKKTIRLRNIKQAELDFSVSQYPFLDKLLKAQH